MNRSLSLITLSFILNACSTALEIIDPNDSPFGYEKKGGSSGTYVRARKIPKKEFLRVSELLVHENYNLESQREIENSLHSINKMVSQSVDVTAESAKKNGIIFGVSSSFSTKESVGHFGLELENSFLNEWLSGRLGLSLLSSDHLYAGGTIGVRLSVPQWIASPYVGAEAYLGDHKVCETRALNQYNNYETCEKVFLGTAYTEMGVRLNLKPHIKMYFFTRGYSKIDQTVRQDLTMFYGSSLFFGNL